MMDGSLLGLHDLLECGFEGGAANQEAIDVLDLYEFVAVLFVHAAAVDHSGAAGLLADLFQPAPDPAVDLCHLLDGGCLASSDGPDWLVGQNDVLPLGDDSLDGFELLLDHLGSLIAFTLLESLSEAVDYFEASFEGMFQFLGEFLIIFSKVVSSFGMSDDDPRDVDILELFGGDFSGVGSK
jgi:hypothetical protein